MSEEELIEVKPEFMGIQNAGYPGAFPPKVEARIRKLVASPCLHLFSGRSKIGDVRVDLERPEATVNMDVFDYLIRGPGCDRQWKWILADPPYRLTEPNRKLLGHAQTYSVAANIVLRSALSDFFQRYTENILWFDQCIPPIKGFRWEKVWLYHLWSWGNIRALTWLKRKGERLA